jgi:hypothetical protein
VTLVGFGTHAFRTNCGPRASYALVDHLTGPAPEEGTMYDLTRFSIQDMVACGDALRGAGAKAANMEQAADGIVKHLFGQLADGAGKPATALVRLYKTHPYGELGEDLRRFADGILHDEPRSPSTKCLTLMASAGEAPAWNGRVSSAGHRAIPLPSAEVVERLPMVAQLIRQLGIEVSSLVTADKALMVDADQKTYNVFYVPQALGSPYVPAQNEFVKPHGIKSVVGFGGLLPSGDLFAVILFTKVTIAEETAQMFRTLALSAKLALLPCARGPFFAA